MEGRIRKHHSLQVSKVVSCELTAPPAARIHRGWQAATITNDGVTSHLHQLRVSQSGAHKDHTIVQVGQTLCDGGLLGQRHTHYRIQK